jgi:hypothetical protein
MSPSALYLTCVSARSWPESKIGLILTGCVGAEGGSAGSSGGRLAFVVAVTLEHCPVQLFEPVGCDVLISLGANRMCPAFAHHFHPRSPPRSPPHDFLAIPLHMQTCT